MTLYSGLFNSVNDDRLYDEWWFARYFSLFIGNGVFPNPSTGLQVLEYNNMMTVVKQGDGWINGYFLVNDGDHILQHNNADGVLDRIDSVVLQLDYSGRVINIVIKKGMPSSEPVAPTIRRDPDYYELLLAEVYIKAGMTEIKQADITDYRLNSDVCGIVHGTVDQVDTTTIFNQYQAFFTDWTEERQNEFDTWFATIQDVLDGDVAGNLTNRILALEDTLEPHIVDDLMHNISVNTVKSNKDSNSIFTIIEQYRKSDGTLYSRSVLSGGTSPLYTTRTVSYYAQDGVTVVKTDVFNLSYDADDDFISEV